MISVSAPVAAVWLASCAYLASEISAGNLDVAGGLLKTLMSAQQQPTAHAIALVMASTLSVYMAIKIIGGLVYETDPLARTWDFFMSFFGQEATRDIKVDAWIDDYNVLHDDSKTNVTERESSYKTMVNAYYELATMFYEWGWGASFHFAYRRPYESFGESIRRHEYYLAGKLGLKTGEKVLDVGCGIGGPYRNIAQFTGADITGITINEYQVYRGNELNRQAGLSQQVRSVQGDFMHLPFDDNSFDGVYAIEATCHAPNREGVYSEIFRVLKPGRAFACYEWCLTDRYDPSSAEHRKIKKQIEEGDALPDMVQPEVVVEALKAVGFEVLETRDVALDANRGGISWYTPLTPSYNIFTQRFQFTPIGHALTVFALRVLEFMRLAPAGTNKVQGMLQQGGMGCANGGITGTFTPMYLAVVRKPAQ
ncbi:sterol methyltransferase [Tribonema minus]|uniref:Methyltransferase n=1 Tax=Tribonema minus TaxID=303371 RepID=A0A836CHN0_9STRA|nr:sterol methyltransferase [Tribonema minus]